MVCSVSLAVRSGVALLAEGVDRNYRNIAEYYAHAKVALLAEGVDRNALHAKGDEFGLGSPSSRRAWIEIGGHRRMVSGSASRPPRGGRG